jgi:uncharacterized protein YcaQ
MPTTLDDLRRFAVARSLFAPTTLRRALHKLGFVQADPIRAPARAQDLVLRHRVRGYRVGDLERRDATLGVHEDFFVNYGFVIAELRALMHPRAEAGVPADGLASWPVERRERARVVLAFVRERGSVHPREVDAHFKHGTVRNYWASSPVRPRTCWRRCTTAACCASRGARAACASTRHTIPRPRAVTTS